jgi:transcriptional regulator with XRE-family HTH domain
MSGHLLNRFGMSPRKQLRAASESVPGAVRRVWIAFGLEVREARHARKWSVRQLAAKAGLSSAFVYAIEAGTSGSVEAAARLAAAFEWRAEMHLVNPRRRADGRASLSADLVHSAMGEFEAAHLRRLQFPVGMDEPYQHYQFAGRADLVAWDVRARALLHIENRTRFPDLQEATGSYNSKKAYLAESLGERVGVRRWASQTHVMAALWSSEALHVLRLRKDTFRSACPDAQDAFAQWWRGQPPTTGVTSTFVALDPLAVGRKRVFIGLDDVLIARPRYQGYADAAAQVDDLRRSPRVSSPI